MKQAYQHRAPRPTLRLRPLAFALFGVSLCSFPGMVDAQVVVAGGNTKVYKAPNGVQVVDIAGANGAGVSHNVFTEFNVARSGMVLNNGDSSQMARQSQLAGQVSANLNLSGGARLILNEVTGTSRSTLAGHVEVLGSRADVVIANPYGLTCDGCGFINTPRVTLTTGVPTLDADGRLAGLRVGGGDVLVSGSGLNATGVDYLDLVARSVRLDGQVNAADLSVVAGVNSWDYASRSAAAGGAGTGAPALGIDSSALGGMYANRIRLLATEEGVGVRLLGDAAASAAELAIDAHGQITVQGRLSAAAGDIGVLTHGAAGTIAVGGRASISAAGDIALATSAPGAGIALDNASLRAGANLRVRSGGPLTDSTGAGNPDAIRFAAGAVDVAVDGAATLDGSRWGAGGALSMRTGSLAVGPLGASIFSGSEAGAGGELHLTSTSGTMDLGGAAVVAHGALALDAGGQALVLGVDGRVAATGAIALTTGRIANAGSVIAGSGLAIDAASLDNSGLLQAATTLGLAATGGIANGAGGRLLAGDALTLHGATLDNRGVVQAGTSLHASLDTALANSGKLLAERELGIGSASASFALDNQGLVQSGGALLVGDDAHRARLVNAAGASLAGQRSDLVLDSMANAGLVQGREGVSVRTTGDAFNAAGGLVLTRGQDGAALSIAAGGALRNEGALQSDGSLLLDARGLLANGGTAVTRARADGGADGAITLHGAAIENSGAIGAAGRLDLTALSYLDNSGTLQGSGPLAATVGSVLSNGATGKLLTLGDLSIGGSGPAFTLDNRNRIQAGGHLAVGSAGSRASLGNDAGAIMLGKSTGLVLGTLANGGTLQGADALVIDAAGSVDNATGGLIFSTGGTLTVHGGADLMNSGSIESAGELSLAAASTLDNRGEIVTLAPAAGGSNGALALGAATLANSGTIASSGSAALGAGGMLNNGLVQSQGSLDMVLGTSLENGAGGILLAGDALRLHGSGGDYSVTNRGRMQAAGQLAIGGSGSLANLANTRGAVLLGGTAALATGDLANDGVIQAAGALRVDARDGLRNSADGQVLTLGGRLDLASDGDLVNAGALQSNQDMGLAAAGLLDNSGTVQTLGGTLDASGAAIANRGNGFVRSAGDLLLAAGSALDNDGKLIAAGNLRIEGGGAGFALNNTGRLQAGGLLAVGEASHPVALANAAAAVILGQQLQLRLASLDNAGLVQGSDAVSIEADGAIVNRAGASLASLDGAGQLALQAGERVDNAGLVQAGGILRVRAGSEFHNTGNVIGVGATSLVSTGDFQNSGLVQGTAGLDIQAAAIGNSGSLLSGAGLGLGGTRGSFALDNSGRIQAGAALAIGSAGGLADIDNRSGGVIVGGELGVAAGRFGNAGLVQGDSVQVSAAGELSNAAGARLLAVGGDGAGLTIEARTVNNEGVVQSSGQLALGAWQIDNHGKLVTVAASPGGPAHGSMAVTSTGMVFTNDGTIASNGTLALRANERIDNLTTGTISARGAMAIDVASGLANNGRIAGASDVSVHSWQSGFGFYNGGELEAGGTLAVGSLRDLADLTNAGSIIGREVAFVGGQLTNQGAQAKLLTSASGGGTLFLYAEGPVRNDGVLHGDGQLRLTAASLRNEATGAASALGELRLDTTRGDLVNDGWLFAGGDVRLSAYGRAITNTASGNIEAGGNLYFDTIGASVGNGSVSNYNNIHTPGNIQVETGSFLNQSGVQLPGIVRGPLVYGGTTEIGDSRDFNCKGVKGSYYDCAHSRLYRFDFTADQRYTFEPADPAQFLAEGNITINYRQAAANRFALISGRNVSINALDGASAFVNADLHLQRETLSRMVWVRVDDDEVHYPTSEAAYNAVAGHESEEEAPGSWATYCNQDWGPCDPWGSLDGVGKSEANYAKLTSSTYLPGQKTYNAGIYARDSFNLSGPIALIGGKPVTQIGTAPTSSGNARGIDTIKAEQGNSAVGLAAPGSGAGIESGLPGAAPGSGVAGLRPTGASGAGKPAGLVPVLVNGAASGMTTVVGANGVPFTGPNLSLPASPNGLYVPAAPSNTSYAVETNPLFVNGGAVGSNYLAQRLGFDPATVQKRLGDANYEAKLVRDQLVAQTNNFLLAGYGRETDQMKGLMDSAASQSAALGLSFGTALTAEQAGRLTDDLVWMVETSVNGQKVLAPVVYLSAATRDAVLSGSVVAARDVRIDGDSVSNNGGTIAASNDLAVTTRGDITNTGGTMRANTVALTSLEGSVVNQTSATFHGNDSHGRTSIGPTGTIAATGNLAIDAARDVRVIGAAVSAGGNATIRASDDVVLDTIQDKRADTSAGATGNANNGSTWSHNEVNVRQVGAVLDTGGNLAISSGRDVTIAGSQVKAGGNAGIAAGRDLNVVDRQDVKQVTDVKKTTSSGFTASGSAVGYAVTDTSETTKTRTGTSVASGISSGGDSSLEAGRTLTVRGSDVAAGRDLAVEAADVRMLAGQDTFEQTIDRKSSTTGVSVGVDISVVKGAIDLARGGTPSVAQVGRVLADGAGNQGVTVGLNASTTTTRSQESNSTARVSTLTSGGKISVEAQNGALFEGTRVAAGGDIDVSAKTVDMLEARNSRSYDVQSETTGLNVSVAVDPMNMARKAVADNVYSGGGGGVTFATVENTRRDLSSGSDKSTLASFTSGGSMTRSATGTLTDQGTQITVAGDFTQKAGTINQLAATDRTHSEETVTTNKGALGVSVDFETKKAFDGLKGGKPDTAIGMLGGPTLGADAKYQRDAMHSSEQSTTARVGNVVAGGNIVSSSDGTTRFEGTRLASGGNTTVGAATLKFDAARDTQSSSQDGNTVHVAARVESDLSGTPGASLTGGYSTTSANTAGSQAVAGGITAAGNLTVTARGDARFEGTQLTAGKDAAISAGGSVDMKSADSTASSSSTAWGVEAQVSASKSNSAKGAGVSVEVDKSSSSSTTAEAGSVRAGNGLAITAGKDLTLVGTTLGAGKDAKLSAGGDVNLLAATSSSSADRTSVSASLSGSRSTKAQSVAAQASVGTRQERASTETGSDIVVGNKLDISSGGKTQMQGTQVDAGSAATIDAKGGLTRRDAVSTSSTDGVQVDAYLQVAAKRGAPAAGSEPTRSRANAVDASQPTRARGTTVTEAPADLPAAEPPSTLSRVKGAAVAVKNAGTKAADRKKSTPLGGAWASKTDESEETKTAVAVREGAAADTARLPQAVNLMAVPAVKSAVQVNAALAAPLAQYGSQAAIPDAVKRAILQQAGVAVAPGADPGALLAQTQNAGKQAALGSLAKSNLNAEQHDAALRAIGLDK